MSRRASRKATPRIGIWLWLAPVVGVAAIIGLAAAASLAQASPEVFVAASLIFSLCEGLVLALIGYAWSARGVVPAAIAACLTAGLAAPGRWEFVAARYGRPAEPTDLALDLLLSLAWGVLAGLAGATILRPKLASITRNDQQRFSRRPPR